MVGLLGWNGWGVGLEEEVCSERGMKSLALGKELNPHFLV